MGKKVDKEFCMSSFLTFRYIAEENTIFKEGMNHKELLDINGKEMYYCDSSQEIDYYLKKILYNVDLSRAALLISGGIDSGILASYMPKGTRAYTAKCSAVGAVDETERAKKMCDKYGLEHIIVDITWQDYLDSIDDLMLQDGCPVFANEPQVYALAKKIKEDGNDIIIFGDNADMAFGGYDLLLAKDWDYEGWKKRFTFVDPKQVLKSPVDMDCIYSKYKIGQNGIDYIKFMDEIFAISSSGAYLNAFKLANIESIDPYSFLKMKKPFDLRRIRSGESKYYLRELFRNKYPEFNIPEKIAMPRAVEQWLSEWEGPQRDEFLCDCIRGLTGEQKFLIYSLERFLNLID